MCRLLSSVVILPLNVSDWIHWSSRILKIVLNDLPVAPVNTSDADMVVTSYKV